jgi:hypothetical protein
MATLHTSPRSKNQTNVYPDIHIDTQFIGWLIFNGSSSVIHVVDIFTARLFPLLNHNGIVFPLNGSHTMAHCHVRVPLKHRSSFGCSGKLVLHFVFDPAKTTKQRLTKRLVFVTVYADPRGLCCPPATSTRWIFFWFFRFRHLADDWKNTMVVKKNVS